MATRRRNGRPPKRIISPAFYIPEGLEDLEYESLDVSDEWDDFEESDGDEPEEEPKNDGTGNGGGGLGKPGVPQIIKVKKQTLRTNNNGNQVVDIVVVITKKNRADGYKFKVTKTNSGKSNRYKIDEDGKVVEKLPDNAGDD